MEKLCYIWVFLSLVLLIFLEAVSPAFIAEYATRPNRLFIEYLQYPKEVIPMLWNGFRLAVLSCVSVSIVAIFCIKMVAAMAKSASSITHVAPLGSATIRHFAGGIVNPFNHQSQAS